MFGFAIPNGAMVFSRAARTSKPKQHRFARWITDARTRSCGQDAYEVCSGGSMARTAEPRHRSRWSSSTGLLR